GKEQRDKRLEVQVQRLFPGAVKVRHGSRVPHTLPGNRGGPWWTPANDTPNLQVGAANLCPGRVADSAGRPSDCPRPEQVPPVRGFDHSLRRLYFIRRGRISFSSWRS